MNWSAAALAKKLSGALLSRPFLCSSIDCQAVRAGKMDGDRGVIAHGARWLSEGAGLALFAVLPSERESLFTRKIPDGNGQHLSQALRRHNAQKGT